VNRPNIATDSRNRGSILLLVLVTMSALSFFALAATENTRTVVEAATLERLTLRAEAAADSAIAFIDKQLALDENWTGTGDWVTLAPTEQFRVRQVETADPMQRHFLVEAHAVDAEVKLRAEFHVDRYTAPVLEHALATLGGPVDMNNVHLVGDLLVVDTQGGVKDYDPLSGEWQTRTSGGDPATSATNNTLDGDLMTFTGELQGVAYTGDNVQLFAPMINPKWNLDSYLTPSSTRIVTTQTSFNNYDTDSTVVVVAPMGASIQFKNSDIRGGVVIWSPPDWPQRGPAYNSINWSSCNFGLPSANPASTDIGMIAPGSELSHGNNETHGYGLFHYHSVGHLNNAHIEGSVWVVNEVTKLNNVDVTYDPALKSVPYEGMGVSAIYTPFDGAREYHGEPVVLVQP